MILVNLLPWREQRKKNEQQLFKKSIVVAAVIVALAMGGSFFYYRQRVNTQKTQNKLLIQRARTLTMQSASLQKFTKIKAKLADQIATLRELQSYRVRTINLLNTVTRIVPKGIHLQEMTCIKNIITLGGEATSNQLISNLVKKIDQSPLLTKPKLSEVAVKQQNGLSVIEFKLTFNLGKMGITANAS